MLSRRNFISAAATMAAALPLRTGPAFGAETSATRPLKDIAKEAGLLYGAAIDSRVLRQDPALAALVAREAGIVVAESETKRGTVQPSPSRYNFAPTDELLRVAGRNSQDMRGHTLIWHESVPPWLSQSLSEAPKESLITDYIKVVAGRYRGRFHSWDVVNEPVAPDDGAADGMRISSPWQKAFGENYIDLAFHSAREADPDAPLFLNELNLEPDVRWGEKRRKAFLNLLDRLIKRNVPINGIGIEAHIKPFRFAYTQDVFSSFLNELSSRGLKILITEFDVADIEGPADPAERDKLVAEAATSFLDVAFANQATLGCLTWGLSDKYSWLSRYKDYQWPDRQLSRGLPFDYKMDAKPLAAAIAQAYQKRTQPKG